MDINRIIAANLTAWMDESKDVKTLHQVKAKSGVGFGTVQRIKNGEGNPTISSLQDIALTFKRQVSELLTPNAAALDQAGYKDEADALRLAKIIQSLPPEQRSLLERMFAAGAQETRAIAAAPDKLLT